MFDTILAIRSPIRKPTSVSTPVIARVNNIGVTTRTIDTHIKNLRQALGSWGDKINTIFGRGFKFVPNVKKK